VPLGRGSELSLRARGHLRSGDQRERKNFGACLFCLPFTPGTRLASVNWKANSRAGMSSALGQLAQKMEQEIAERKLANVARFVGGNVD